MGQAESGFLIWGWSGSSRSTREAVFEWAESFRKCAGSEDCPGGRDQGGRGLEVSSGWVWGVLGLEDGEETLAPDLESSVALCPWARPRS